MDRYASQDTARRLQFALGTTKRPKTLRCRWCDAKITVDPRGRLPEYCSHGCRQRAYEKRKWAPPDWSAPLAHDLADAGASRARHEELRDARSLRALDEDLRRIGFIKTPKRPR